MRAWIPVPALLLPVSVASASTFAVATTNDTGRHSLRWAIEQANAHGGADDIIVDPILDGAVIAPRSQLPDLTGYRTTINGDIDGDGMPNIAISGARAGGAYGLVIKANRCVVRGLTIAGFARQSIVLSGVEYCRIVSCELGVSPRNRFRSAVGEGAIHLWNSHNNTIGGTAAKGRNIICPGRDSMYPAIAMRRSSDNRVIGNYFGLAADGNTLLGTGLDGILITGASGPVDGNQVGGSAPGAGNVFAGLRFSVALQGATNTRILGNLFGFKADGDTLAPCGTCVHLGSGTTNTQIGGTTPGARNVFAGVMTGDAISIQDVGTADNVIQGNYFGTNQAGTERRRLGGGISIWQGAGSQVIGGDTPAAGNYFAGFRPVGPTDGVRINAPGSASIRNNTFGLLPAGGGTTGLGTAIGVCRGTAWVVDNTITHASAFGLRVWGDGAHVSAFRNVFRHCREAVDAADDVTCRLGNLANASGGDDGGNKFHPSNDWFIYNGTLQVLKAEGNNFFTTSMAEIDAKIYDKLDCPSAGRVDYIPLEGGVIPTGGTSLASLALTNAAAISTKAGGAEIAFSLSAPADVTVTVLNIAGRPVATVLRDQAADAGTQRVVWSGRASQGPAAPDGTYVVRIVARGQDGAHAQAIASLNLRR